MHILTRLDDIIPAEPVYDETEFNVYNGELTTSGIIHTSIHTTIL